MSADEVAPIPIEEDPTIARDVLKWLIDIRELQLPAFTDDLPAYLARIFYNQLNIPKSDEEYYNEGIEVVRNIVKDSPKGAAPLHLVRPVNTSTKLNPAFIFYRGGGFVLFDFGSQLDGVVELVKQTGLTAVFIDYSLAPENPFPIALEQTIEATKWVIQNGATYPNVNINTKKISIVGLSAGGTLTIAVAMELRDKHPELYNSILSMVLISPWLDLHNERTPSWIKFGVDRFATEAQLDWSFKLYIKNGESSKYPPYYLNPTRAPKDALRRLPPTFLQISESDPVSDKLVTFGQQLDAAEVRVTAVTYHGAIHTVGFINDLSHISLWKSYALHAASELKNVLFAPEPVVTTTSLRESSLTCPHAHIQQAVAHIQQVTDSQQDEELFKTLNPQVRAAIDRWRGIFASKFR